MRRAATAEVLKSYLREAMVATGTQDAAGLARKAGLNPATVWRLLTTDLPLVSPRPETLRRLQTVSGRPLPAALAELLQEPGLAEAGAPPPLPEAPEPSAVAVHAMVGTRTEGRFHLNRAPFEHVRRPPGLIGKARAFAVRMPDDSMAPWREPNELVFVQPEWTVAPGNHVLVEIANTIDEDGPSLYAIRRFLSADRHHARLGRYGARGPETETLPRQSVLSMSRIIEWPEVAFG